MDVSVFLCSLQNVDVEDISTLLARVKKARVRGWGLVCPYTQLLHFAKSSLWPEQQFIHTMVTGWMQVPKPLLFFPVLDILLKSALQKISIKSFFFPSLHALNTHFFDTGYILFFFHQGLFPLFQRGDGENMSERQKRGLYESIRA